MSADDSILLLRLALRGRYVWIVLHVQAIENFGSDAFVEWYLAHEQTVRFTTRRSVAVCIARRKAAQNKVEHGLCEVQSSFRIPVDKCDIAKGVLTFTFSKPECSFGDPKNRFVQVF